MVASKKKRTDLEVPSWIKEQWAKGTQAKEEMAAALQEVNWSKARFQMFVYLITSCVSFFFLLLLLLNCFVLLFCSLFLLFFSFLFFLCLLLLHILLTFLLMFCFCHVLGFGYWLLLLLLCALLGGVVFWPVFGQSSVFCFCFCCNGDAVPGSLMLSFLCLCWVLFLMMVTYGDPTSCYPFCLGQEKFIDMMENIITNKNSVRLTKDEGWYSEGEMKSELGWSSYIS